MGEVDGFAIYGFTIYRFFHEIIDKEGACCSRFKSALCFFRLQHVVRRDEHLRFRVLQHIAQSLVRILKVQWRIEGSIYKKNILRPTNGRHPSCDVYTYDLRYNNASASVGGKWNNITLDVDWNRHAYYYDYTAKHYDYVLLEGEEYGDQNGEWFSVAMLPGQSKLQSDQQRVMGLLKGIFKLPYDNTLNAGAEYRYDYLKAPERTETGTADDWTGALYVQDEWHYVCGNGIATNLTTGLRLVDNHNFGFHLTPKMSAMLSAGDFRFRVGWSQGFKTPTVKELHYRYLHMMGSSIFFNIGNINLNPQTSNYYSANVEYRGQRFTAAVTGYLNKLDNMITLVNVSEGIAHS